MSKADKHVIFSILNIVLLTTIVFKTVINFYWFVLTISLICIIINKLINRNIFKIQDKQYFFVVVFPHMVNCFFLINYFTGMNPQKETYCFKNTISEVGGRKKLEKILNLFIIKIAQIII